MMLVLYVTGSGLAVAPLVLFCGNEQTTSVVRQPGSLVEFFGKFHFFLIGGAPAEV